ncbi:MAG: hypothetical protein H6739_32775 [Alphaproteobacteria bacterium]|nr:hypothetical protein [Alphaproteobacteria bacterium]
MLLETLLMAAVAAPPDPPPVHLEHATVRLAPRSSRPAPPPLPAPLPDVWVYGYLPYWVGGLDDVPWERMTHVALFDVALESDGSISGTSFWDANAADAVEQGAAHGVKIHLTVTCFSNSVMGAVLPDPTRRARAVQELADLVNGAGAHGVSVDFEGMDYDYKQDLVDFVAELAAAVEEVTVATPAVDWQGAYDYDELAFASSGLFIMGYGYHWSGGNPGPIAPLYGEDPWSDYALDWSVADYRSSGAPDDKIILGLPLYGRNWPTTDNSVPGSATGSGSAVVMVDAVDDGAQYGRRYDDVTETPYAFPDATHQLWYDDTESVAAKVGYAVDEGLLGVGFWALGYDGGDPAFWAMMAERTSFDPGGEDTGGPVDDTGEPVSGPLARAGQDILAYVGQVVVLNGTGSRGEDLGWAWTQEGGPVDVGLRDADTDAPRFDAEVAGTYRFSLVVTEDGVASEPDMVTVVVTDLDAVAKACGCGGGIGGASAFAVAGILLLARRRRL